MPVLQVRPILTHNFNEGNISLDQKLAEYYGSATRFPSMTLSCRERNILVYAVSKFMQLVYEAYRSMFIEEATLSKTSKRVK